MLTLPPAALAFIAQGSQIPGLFDRALTTLTGAVSAFVAFALFAMGGMYVWKGFFAAWRDQPINAFVLLLATIVGAAFMMGATPDVIAAAHHEGTIFLDGVVAAQPPTGTGLAGKATGALIAAIGAFTAFAIYAMGGMYVWKSFFAIWKNTPLNALGLLAATLVAASFLMGVTPDAVRVAYHEGSVFMDGDAGQAVPDLDGGG